MKRYLLAALSALFTVSALSLAFKATENVAASWVVAAGFALLTVWLFRRARDGKKKQHSAPVDNSPHFGYIDFRVAGTTYKSEGVSRQTLLKKIKFGDPPFENRAALDFSLKPSTFEGEPSIECRVNGLLIGYVPKAMVPEVLVAMKKPGATISAFDIIGGGTVDGKKLNYGAKVVLRYVDS